MTTFDDREKSFERKFIHDKELGLQVQARRNKLLGQWAAEKLGKKGADAEQYALSLAMLQIDDRRKDVVSRVLHDLHHGGLKDITAKDIRIELEHFFAVAQEQIAGSGN